MGYSPDYAPRCFYRDKNHQDHVHILKKSHNIPYRRVYAELLYYCRFTVHRITAVHRQRSTAFILHQSNTRHLNSLSLSGTHWLRSCILIANFRLRMAHKTPLWSPYNPYLRLQHLRWPARWLMMSCYFRRYGRYPHCLVWYWPSSWPLSLPERWIQNQRLFR